jgi:hypothetical protein
MAGKSKPRPTCPTFGQGFAQGWTQETLVAQALVQPVQPVRPIIEVRKAV